MPVMMGAVVSWSCLHFLQALEGDNFSCGEVDAGHLQRVHVLFTSPGCTGIGCKDKDASGDKMPQDVPPCKSQ